MKPRVPWAAILAAGLMAALNSYGQPLVSHPQPASDLDEKWEWALDRIDDNEGNGWIGYGFTTSFDEKLNALAIARSDDFIRWNNQSGSRYWGYGGYTSWEHWNNGISIASLQSGSTDSQQPAEREVELVLLARIDGNDLELVQLTTPATARQWQGLPVFWLDQAGNDESFRLLSGLLEPEQKPDLQRALVNVLGLHTNADRLGFLNSLYNTEQWQRMRPWIVQAIAIQRGNEVESMLLDIAQDENAELTERRIAISALSRYATTVTEDAIITLAGELNPMPIREEAIESLGLFGSADTARLLRDIVFSDSNESLQEQAVESLIFMPAPYDALAEIAREHVNSEIREEALEQLIDIEVDAAIDDLAWLIENDDSQDVRRAAVEELDEGPYDSVVPILFGIIDARTEQPVRVRREAVEALGEFNSAEVTQRLNEIAWSDDQERIRDEAVESLAELNTPAARALLLEIARDHPNHDTREEALEELEDSLF